jgi:hypothetical protein
LLAQDDQDAKAELGEEKAQPSSSSSKPQEPAGEPPVPDKDLNRRVALLSTLGAVSLFASQRFKLGGFSLKDLAANAVPYEEVSDSSSLNSVLNNVKTTYAGKKDSCCAEYVGSTKCQQKKKVSLPFYPLEVS